MRASCLLLLLWLPWAQSYGSETEPPPDAGLIEFLEFLGEWETPEGEWYDPLPGDAQATTQQQDDEVENDDDP